MILHLDSLRGVRHRGPVRSAMAAPDWRYRFSGWCMWLAPPLESFRGVFARRRDPRATERYRAELLDYYDWLLARQMEGSDPLALYWPEDAHPPDDQGWRHPGPWSGEVCGDGDTVVCACPRPDQPRQHPFCHLEILAPLLACWGSRRDLQITLYGRALDESGQPVPTLRRTAVHQPNLF